MALPLKGSALPIKKILGIVLLVWGVYSIFNFSVATTYAYKIPILSSIIIIIAGYFLAISGRQL